MKAKDTVISENKLKAYTGHWIVTLKQIAEAQAKISFEAGYEQALKDNNIKK